MFGKVGSSVVVFQAKKIMADSYYKSQDAKRDDGLQFASWRSTVISSGITKFVNKDMIIAHMTKLDHGCARLTCGPPNDRLGTFELYVRGRRITVKYTIRPDDTYTKYVLSSESRSGDKHVFPDMHSLVSYCKIHAMELSNDKDDYETIRELDALRVARLCERDICDEMGSLELREENRKRLGGRRLPLPPFVDRTTKPGPKRDGSLGTRYKGSRADRPPLSDIPPVESGHYLKHGTSGAVKKVEFDGDYGWLSEFY